MTDPCPHCGDTTGHESDEALCGCLAMLVEARSYPRYFRKRLDGFSEVRVGLPLEDPEGWSLLPIPVCDYLNDPAETMRMLEWLLDRGYHPDRWVGITYIGNTTQLKGEALRSAGIDSSHSRCLGAHRDTPKAIARAYHAMKLAEWVAKQEAEHE